MLLTDGLLTGNKRLQEIANGGKPMRPGFPKEEAEAVRKVQKALAKIMGPMPKSYPNGVAGEPDGEYGAETKRFVAAFQMRSFPRSSSEWDGFIGPKTISALNSALSTGKPPSPPAVIPPVPKPSTPLINPLRGGTASPAFCEKVDKLLLIAAARQRSAIRVLDWAQIAVDFDDTNEFNKEALALVNRCFHIYAADLSKWKSIIGSIRKVYESGTEMFPYAHSTKTQIFYTWMCLDVPTAGAVTYGFWKTNIPGHEIWVCEDRCANKSGAFLLDVLTHESAHFCGPQDDANKIGDFGYGPKALLLPQSVCVRNAANYAWFAGLSETSHENWEKGGYPS
jgi:hypothetical protein